MLPRDPASSMARAMVKLEAGARLARRRLPSMLVPLSTDLAEMVRFSHLGASLLSFGEAVDIVVLSHQVDRQGRGTWEVQCSCRHCGSTDVHWPASPDDLERDPSLRGNVDPYLAEAMCGGCFQYLGSAVALKGLFAWLAAYEVRLQETERKRPPG